MENNLDLKYEEFEEPTATNEMKHAEAVRRMKALGIMTQVVEEFDNSEKLEFSEPTRLGGSVFGALYWVDNEPQWAELVKEFEETYDSLAYHVIHSYAEFGELLNILYVSNYPEEWGYDNADLQDGYVMSYVINLDFPEFSEFGTISVLESGGGLLRIG